MNSSCHRGGLVTVAQYCSVLDTGLCYQIHIFNLVVTNPTASRFTMSRPSTEAYRALTSGPQQISWYAGIETRRAARWQTNLNLPQLRQRHEMLKPGRPHKRGQMARMASRTLHYPSFSFSPHLSASSPPLHRFRLRPSRWALAHRVLSL